MPKPPPTSGVTMRNFSGSVPNSGPIRFFTSQPPWVLAYSVQRPVAASKSASAARASIEFTTMRLLTTVSFVTCAALANSASVAALSPISQSNARLLLHLRPDQRRTPASIAVARSVIGGQDVVIDLDRLGRVARLLDGLGDDEGDRVADMPHRAVGQHRMRRRGLRRAVAVVPPAPRRAAGPCRRPSGRPRCRHRRRPAAPPAAAVSSRVIFAAACGLRSTMPNSMPGSTMSSV